MRPEGWSAPSVLPLDDMVKARRPRDSVFHKEIIAKHHPVFDGLQSGGILDWNYYDQVIGHDIFDCEQVPHEVVAASFAVGFPRMGGYDSGVIISAFKRGKGRIILNALRVLEQLDRNPVADRLLLNLISYAQGR
jgi:hypothetical protein